MHSGCARGILLLNPSQIWMEWSLDSILVGTVYLWSWESFILQVKQYLPQQKLGHGEYTGERVVVKEITIKGKVIPSILSEYYLFHHHL